MQPSDSNVPNVEAASRSAVAAANVTAIQNDPDDNAIIAAAIAGQAEVICTRDRQQDVMDFCARQGIRIIDDIESLIELRAMGGQGQSTAQP